VSQLPNLGDGNEMTISAERRMGDRIAREIYRDPDYIDDPLLTEYLQGIWQPLLAAARLRGELPPELDERFAFELMVGKDRSVNAFALPGGYFGVHLGLMAVVTSRDELASVLGHELSHVTQRHIARLIAKQGAQTPWLVGAMILGMLAAAKSPETANALIMGGQAVAAQNQLNFSRDMEREADRIGFGVMTQAGFEPQGFVTMFDKLAQASRHNDSGSFPYLRSHPLTTERIADMQARMPARAPGSAAVAAPATSLEHAMLSARSRVLSYSAVDELRSWSAQIASPAFASLEVTRKAASLYGAALAAIRLRNFPEGAAMHSRLLELTKDNAAAARLTRLLAMELALAGDDAPRALSLVSDGAAGATRPEVMLAAQALTRSGQPAQAAQRLQMWLADHPRDAHVWQLLASAYAAQGLMLRAIRAEAEARAAQHDFDGAMDRFKAAQELARRGTSDHIEASIIDTRAREVALLLREQAVER
jgi:predicted Zn-dependent protease